MPETQASRVATKLSTVPVTPPGPDQPTVIIPSALSHGMTRDQEAAMMYHARNRLQQLSDELGRYDYTTPNWIGQAAANIRSGNGVPFLAKRHLGHVIFQQRFEWRAQMLGGIFAESNLHLPQTRRIVQQQIARAVAHFFGSDPWLSASPVPNGVENDAELSDQAKIQRVDAWVKHEAAEAKLSSTLAEALHLTFIQGEQIVKTYHEKKVSYYKTWATVAIGADGQPIPTQHGDYIFEDDKFIPADPSNPTGSPLVMARDGVTPQPAGPLRFERTLIERKITHFSGARCTNVHFMDFLAPLTAPDLQSADCCVHLYAEPVINLINRLLEMEWRDSGLDASGQLARIAELARMIIPSGGDHEKNRAASESPRGDQRETTGMTGRDALEPSADLAEVWMHYDANGDGVVENIMLLMDKDGRVPIFYDHVPNVTHDGLRPFEAVVINKVAGRWHGQGEVENFSALQHQLDLTVNRWNFHQTSAARVDFWDPSKVVEGDGNPTLKLNWGKTYRKRDSLTPASQILESVYLRDIKGPELQQQLQLLMQMMMNMGGVANANDSRMAGLDTAQLATGINNIAESGEELFGKFLQDMTPSVLSIVQGFTGLTLAHLDTPRVFKFFEYDQAAQEMVARVAEFTPEEARNLRLDIKLELTRQKQQQEAAQGDVAWRIGTEYYNLRPGAPQNNLAELAQQRLRIYGVRNTKQVIQPEQPPMPVDPMTGQPMIDPMTGQPIATTAPPPVA